MVTIIVVLAIAAGVTFLLVKSGKLKDDNGNNIPDVVEKPVVEVVAKVKKTAKKVVDKKSTKKSK
jgi:ribonucleotide monophosphatase NagD (HAD superfamily)